MKAHALGLLSLTTALALLTGCTATAPDPSRSASPDAGPSSSGNTPRADKLGSEPISDYYAYTGSVTKVMVPPDATQVDITAVAGRGGDSGGHPSFGTVRPGGSGAAVTASWTVHGGQLLTLAVGGGGSRQAGGWGNDASGGKGGCSNGGGGGGATTITLDGNTILIAGGGGGGGYYGASAVTDEGGNGGVLGNGQDGSGPNSGKGGSLGGSGSAVGGQGGNGKNLGGCAGGGGGGAHGGSGGTGGSTGGGGGGGGGAGSSTTSGSLTRPVYTTDTTPGITNGHVLLTFTPQNHN